MAVSRSKRKKRNTKQEGIIKQRKNRAKLFNDIYSIYMDKSYPVLHRFATLVNKEIIKISFIRKAALEMALNTKMQEAIEKAKMNLMNKVEKDE